MGVDSKTHNLILIVSTSDFDEPAATESEARKFSGNGLWALNSIGRQDCGQAAVSLIRNPFVPLEESSVSRYTYSDRRICSERKPSLVLSFAKTAFYLLSQACRSDSY